LVTVISTTRLLSLAAVEDMALPVSSASSVRDGSSEAGQDETGRRFVSVMR
jgi:hypothetical protein